MKKGILTLASVLALVAMLAMPMAALAATGEVIISGGTATVTPTALSLTGDNTLTGAELLAASASTANPWTANDPRGTGLGWNLTIISTDFGSPLNEKQTITTNVATTAGHFHLLYGTKTTGEIAFGALNTAVEAALELLTNIEAVTVTGGPLTSTGNPFLVEFVNPGNQNVDQMTADITALTTSVLTIATTVIGAPGIDISAVADQEFDIQILDADITMLNGSLLKPTSAVTSMTAIPFTGGSPQSIVTAAVATGMGNYSIKPSFQLHIPAETYANTYTATLTVSINLAP